MTSRRTFTAKLSEAVADNDIDRITQLFIKKYYNCAQDNPARKFIDYLMQERLDKALFEAAKTGDAELLEQLLAAGADINAKDRYGYTPLHLAAKKSNTEAVRLLIEAGADLDIKDENGSTPLHLAETQWLWRPRKCVECIQLLVNAGADVSIKNNLNKTVLHNVACRGDIGTIRLLIEKGADIDAKDSGGGTPIDILQIECPDLYRKHIDELRNLAVSARQILNEDAKKSALTDFEFDI